MRVRMWWACALAVVGFSFSAPGAVFTVTNAAASGPGTLAEAVLDANGAPPPNVIQFNLPGPTPVTIALDASLLISQPVLVDGTTQPGYASNAPAVWVVNTAAVAFAFHVATSNTVVRGVRVSGFSTYGILLSGSSNRVEGCHAISNNAGVGIDVGQGSVIGGPAASNLNVISGNTSHGIQISGPGAAENIVMGNWIGVSATNSAVAQGNGGRGIRINSSEGNAILGAGAVRQVISGNAQSGITIDGSPSSNNVIRGNHIGVDAAGLVAVSNTLYGIEIASAPGTLIGGTNTIDRNVISGNADDGVLVSVASAANTVLEGNYIGVSASGTTTIPNQANGVYFLGPDFCRIGGPGTGQGNLIGGNKFAGVSVSGGSDFGQLQGNFIGINPAGTVLANQGDGVQISGSNWLVGGSNVAARNVISGNIGYGLMFLFASQCRAAGNYVGIDAGGAAKSNMLNGIYLNNSVACEVGGTTTNEANVVCGNIGGGISVFYGSSNTIRGNYVGVLPSGTVVSNRLSGIMIQGSTGVVVGGSTPGERNVVSGNGEVGVSLVVPAASAWIKGNYIGLNPAGTAAARTTGVAGVSAYGFGHVIGGTNSGEGNVISGNGGVGIFLNGSQIVVAGNRIGLASNGFTIVSNHAAGVQVGPTTNCVIGGATPGARNVIGGNLRGIEFASGGNLSNVIAGNYMSVGVDGTSVVRNAGGDIVFSQSGQHGRVGGHTPGERNVLGQGIVMATTNAINNVIAGNYIGVDALARQSTGTLVAVDVNAGSSNLLGGTASGAANVIGGRNAALRLFGAAITGNRIEGNLLGLGTNGQRLSASSPSGAGISVVQASGNTIGGTNPAAGNIVGYHARGIEVLVSNRNAIVGNLVISNTSLAVDLQGDLLVQGNDVLDADVGANDLQNAPFVTNAQSFFGSTFVQGYLPSKASSTYRIEFFTSPDNVQLIRYLGFTNVTTAANGTGTFTAVLGGYTPTGLLVRASATDTNGNTSEFFPGALVTPAADTDNDKMPNYWETFYGLNPSVSNSATADLDGDGVSDFAEYVADTRPNDSASFFELVDLAPAAPGQAVSFPTSHTRAYDVEGTTNLVIGTWTPLVTNLAGNGNARTVTDPNTGVTNFYRARATIPPR